MKKYVLSLLFIFSFMEVNYIEYINFKHYYLYKRIVWFYNSKLYYTTLSTYNKEDVFKKVWRL